MRALALAASLIAGAWCAAAAPMGPLTDAQVAGALNALDLSEIHEADFMAGATADGDVKRFATGIIDDHTALDRNVASVAARLSLGAADSPLAAEARRSSAQELDKLKHQTGPAVDRIYLQDSIAWERGWLDQVDRVLAPSAQDPDVRSLVSAARRTILRHLEQAQALQSRRGNR